MTLFLAALVAVVAGCATAGLIVWGGPVLRRRRRRGVIVTLKSGDAFRGTLTGSDRWTVVLRHAESIGDGRPIAVDGELLLPSADVRYMQRL